MRKPLWVSVQPATMTEFRKEVIRCFQELCDSYRMKQIDLTKWFSRTKSYDLVE
jgi:hypothetical protein